VLRPPPNGDPYLVYLVNVLNAELLRKEPVVIGKVLSTTTLPASVVTSSLTTVGSLDSGSITDGFGAIDIGVDPVTCGALKVGVNQVVGARSAAVAAPVGGTVIDVESRASLAALISRVEGHGLIVETFAGTGSLAVANPALAGPGAV
jgi:hypothetical protein